MGRQSQVRLEGDLGEKLFKAKNLTAAAGAAVGV